MKHLIEEEINSEKLLEGKLLHVYRDRVRLPDGNQADREWIDHPGAAAVLPILPNGSALMIRQYRYAAKKLFIEMPAGKFDSKNEKAEAVAARELEEETGWKAGRMHYVGHSHPCIGYSNEIIHYFVAEDLTEGTKQLQDAEFIETVELPLEEVFRMAEEGEIDDMKTVTGLFLARAFLRRRQRENENN